MTFIIFSFFFVTLLAKCPTPVGFGLCVESCSKDSTNNSSSCLPGYECCYNGYCHSCVCTSGFVPCPLGLCKSKTCKLYPDAECSVDACGGCNVYWTVNGARVNCEEEETGTEIIATWYCSLDGSHGSCFPGDCGIDKAPSGLGIAALNPKAFSGTETCHYKGSACGKCWRLQGPAGEARVQITDCCAGYPHSCSCLECPDKSDCDWCAHNDHLHFDLDLVSFKAVCGEEGYQAGDCRLYSASRTSC
eukprot:TRINITY_DN1647_c0_g1_i2.p1 TRINITY_DN1647_c0_g1~~TRINITY_DN1647_c0_g1_i2.p1  ORF type:complete len:247 (-),score=29.08 TRINITY_DN1647_c0_g1_i2:63-803(-)